MNSEPVICWNLCEKDCQSGMAVLDWLHDLDGQQPYDCVIGQDATCNRHLAKQFIEKATRAFEGVQVYVYERPQQVTWPQVGNQVWITAAKTMQEIGRPWFWWENDVIPLKENSINALFEQYEKAVAAGKPIMGPMIPGRGHVNGTAIYPANTPDVCRAAMAARDLAWDWQLVEDCRHLLYDCSGIFQHAWGIEHGKLSISGGDGAPSFRNVQQVRDWIRPEAYLFHRCKDLSLLFRLREMRSEKPKICPAGGGGAVMSL